MFIKKMQSINLGKELEWLRFRWAENFSMVDYETGLGSKEKIILWIG